MNLEKLFKNEGEAKKKELAEIEQLMKKAEKQVDLSQKRSREMQTQIKGNFILSLFHLSSYFFIQIWKCNLILNDLNLIH